jgi:hypothetical protein
VFGQTIRLGASERQMSEENARDAKHGKSPREDRHRESGDRHEDDHD